MPKLLFCIWSKKIWKKILTFMCNLNIDMIIQLWQPKKKDDTWDTCIFSWFVIGGSYGLHVSSVTCYVLDMHIFL
jgi:hypothetical protein